MGPALTQVVESYVGIAVTLRNTKRPPEILRAALYVRALAYEGSGKKAGHGEEGSRADLRRRLALC
jgi:hypothetical protein